ncbi:MAG: gliding motility-associated C-terminal domain-containing protein [Saprospiraceae bacterium]|nr:gliding motility-associated C-terminal domain-containing protein [Saprospiraceae bacterium]
MLASLARQGDGVHFSGKATKTNHLSSFKSEASNKTNHILKNRIMLRKFLFLLLITTIGISTARAQTLEFIAPPRFEAAPRTPLACVDGKAGGTQRVLGVNNKNKGDIRYLCIGDSLFLTPDGTANLTNDSVTTTPPGIGYFFYNCKPTVTGPTYLDFAADPCLFRNSANNFLAVSRGIPSGRDTFFNAGTLQQTFGNGRPVKFYFAPVTMTDFFGASGGSAGFDSRFNCINVNTNDRMNAADTFSVVYLNAVNVQVTTLTSTGGSFVVSGGLSEYDGTSTYTYTIRLATDPLVLGTVTSGANATNGGTVSFTVPREGTYIITARDGKSCDGQTTARFPNMTFQISDNIVRQGDTSCVTVSAKNFKNIVSIQSAFQFDPAVVQLVGVRNTNLPGLDPISSFNSPIGSNAIAFSWASSNASGVTRADDERLFEICFKAIGTISSVSPIRITDTLVNVIEVADSVNDPLTGNRILGVSLKNGSITIGNLDFTTITRADSARCFGENGRFRVNITGGGAPFRYNWQSATNPAQNGTGTINTVNDTAIVINRPAGKYYVTVTNAANVQKVDSVDVRQPAVLFLNPPTAVNPTCANDSDGSLTLSGFGGGTPNYSFKWTTGATTAAITGLAAGPYGVTLTDAKGCQDSIPRFSIGVNPIAFTGRATEATCKGVNTGSINIPAVQGGTTIGGSYTFRWSFNNTTNVGANSTLPNLPPGQYFVTVTDRNNCPKVDSFQVDALRTVESSAVIGNIACFGQTNGFINATASTRGSEAQPYTFTWSGLVGTPTNTATTTFVRNLAAGTYALTVTDRDQCRFDTTFTIRTPDSIRLTLASLTNETCVGNGTNGSNGTIAVVASGGTAPYTYSWSRDPADINPSITGLRAGTYTLTVRDSSSCIKARDYTISAPVFPIIDSFRIINATCSDRNDGSARVFYRAGTGTRIQSVRWSNAGFLDSISPVLAGNYLVTVTADNGCVRTDTAKITAPARIKVDTARTVKFDPPCPRQATGRAIVIVQGGTAPYSYNWSGGATQSGAVFASLGAGSYRFTITDSNGCSPDSITITLIDPPSVQVTFTDIEGTSCYGTCDGKAKASARGGSANTGLYSYNWSSGEITNNAASSKATQLCGGWQFVTVSDAVCVYPPDSVFIQRPDSFSFITPPIVSPSCKGDRDGSAEIRPRGGTLPYSYLWSNGSTRNTIVNVAAGRYTVTVTDAQFCPFTLVVTIDEPDSLKIDTVPLLSQNVSCYGLADGFIKLRRTGGNGATAQTNYEWIPAVSQSDSAKGLKSGAYTIIGTDGKGCRNSITISLTQPDPIFFYMPPLTQPRCNGELTTLRIDTAFGSTYQYPFSVSVDNGPQYPIGYFIPVFAGRHEINIIEQVSGCTLDTAVTISEPPPLSLRFDTLGIQNQIAKILVGLGDSVRINPLITSALPIDSVVWTPRTYLSFRSDPLRPFTRPLDDITYKLTIVDVNGCSTSEQLFVELDRNRNIFIPNIFSPNGDDRNDYFGVFNGVGVKMINFVRIFDRWGEMMFTKNKILPNTDITEGWDGTFKGKVVENGVYIYIIEVEFEDGQKLVYRGDISVAR